MDGYDLLRAIQRWRDKNGMVKPQASWRDSGNGLLYSAVYLLLMNELNPNLVDGRWYRGLVSECTPPNRPGLLQRTPENSFGLQGWDDYLGVAAACILIGEMRIPQEILKYGIRHFGFYNNSPTFTFKAWLWRALPLWPLMWVAAFPRLKMAFWPVMWVFSKAMNPYSADPSGLQLIWVYHAACKAAGLRLKKFETVSRMLPPAFARYYDLGHPFVDAAREIQ